jgi:hypothetical protein
MPMPMQETFGREEGTRRKTKSPTTDIVAYSQSHSTPPAHTHTHAAPAPPPAEES